jgi:thioredoxin 1
VDKKYQIDDNCSPQAIVLLSSKTKKPFVEEKKTKTIMALEITTDNFDEIVAKSDKPVLVDFWAEWCGPCRMVGPVVEELSKDYEGKAVVGKLNVDEHGEIAERFGIRNIPTLLVFKGGEVVDKQVGVAPKNVLAGKLDGAM